MPILSTRVRKKIPKHVKLRQATYCNCAHRMTDHADTGQCSRCPCPAAIPVPIKEVMEWKVLPVYEGNDESYEGDYV